MSGRFCALFGLIVASIAQSATAAPLQPNSKWHVDYDEAQCTATRNYGTDDKPLLLVLKPSPYGGSIRLLLISAGASTEPARQLEASVQFDGQPRIETTALKYSGGQRTVRSINLPMADVKAQQNAKTISIASAGSDYSFALSDVPPLLGALEKCRVALLEFWKADRTDRIRQEARPLRRLADLYSPRDYPRAAVRDDNQGTVSLSLLVDATGKVMDCSIDSSTGAARLDQMSCYILQNRATFRPALDKDGKPARSIYNQRISWKIRR